MHGLLLVRAELSLSTQLLVEGFIGLLVLRQALGELLHLQLKAGHLGGGKRGREGGREGGRDLASSISALEVSACKLQCSWNKWIMLKVP